MRDGATRLVVVADDFGRTSGVNRATVSALKDGIVTAASLMAGGEAFEEAAGLAREHRRLGVGLHVTVCDGFAVLPPDRFLGFAGGDGGLERNPTRAGVRLWRERRRLLPVMQDEIKAQFDRAERAGIPLTHVDGHHHMHIHPLVFPIVCREAAHRGVGWIRIPRGDPRDGRLAEWALFGVLGSLNGRTAARHGLDASAQVHGLSRTGRIDEAYLLDLLPRLRPGWNEIFVHPDLDTVEGRRELAAVTAPRVREEVARLGIALVSYASAGTGAAS